MHELEITDFGNINKQENAQLYTLTNHSGVKAAISDLGATLVQFIVPDKHGEFKDLVLGYDNAMDYMQGDASLGAIIGRNANRIGKAMFEVNGETIYLSKNDGENNLHSGPNTYNKRLWKVKELSNQKITFRLHSPDGDQGYSGTMDIEVTYELTDENELFIRYFGTTNKDTVVNMTNHSYFNLNGHDSGSALNHLVKIFADSYTPSDKSSIPTGKIVPVKDTPMNFVEKKSVGQDIESDYQAIQYGKGYDHNYVLNDPGTFRKVAEVTGDKSEITMEVYTDLPGLQFYTANYLENEHGKSGALYQRRNALCFETQYFPDAVHHPNFELPICKMGESYQTVTMYKFIVV